MDNLLSPGWHRVSATVMGSLSKACRQLLAFFKMTTILFQSFKLILLRRNWVHVRLRDVCQGCEIEKQSTMRTSHRWPITVAPALLINTRYLKYFSLVLVSFFLISPSSSQAQFPCNGVFTSV